MKYAIVPFPIPEIIIKSGLIAQKQETARTNNSKNQCIVSYKPSFNNTLSQYPNFDTVAELNTFLDKNPQEWDIEYMYIQDVSISGVSEVVNKEATGISHSIPTHDFSDRTTWYTMSKRVEGLILNNPNGLVYSLPNENIIDLVSGKVTRENSIESTYGVRVYSDGNLIDNSNYSVNYELGEITLNNTVSGELTINYSYENGSSFIISPPEGKIYKIKDAEIQFTQDLQMKPVEFELWVYNPQFNPEIPESVTNPLRIKIVENSDVYKNYKDIINIAKRGAGKIASIPGFQNDIMVFPFHYDRVIELKSSMGMQVRLKVMDESPMVGEWGTMTFYVIEEQE